MIGANEIRSPRVAAVMIGEDENAASDRLLAAVLQSTE
jgi:hypothetical protein